MLIGIPSNPPSKNGKFLIVEAKVLGHGSLPTKHFRERFEHQLAIPPGLADDVLVPPNRLGTILSRSSAKTLAINEFRNRLIVSGFIVFSFLGTYFAGSIA